MRIGARSGYKLAMPYQDVMAELEAAGSEQTRKTYRRHGAPDPMFGVSFAKLEAMRKRLKKQHALAEELWASGNADARVLATMIADPARATRESLEAWCQSIRHHGLAGSFADFAVATPFAREVLAEWIDSPRELVARVGWNLVGLLAMSDPVGLEADYASFVPRIEAEIPHAPNRVKEAMNSALIAIGIRSEALSAIAIAAARRIGRVEVDHGDTACKTPEAEPYILKARARKQAREARRAPGG